MKVCTQDHKFYMGMHIKIELAHISETHCHKIKPERTYIVGINTFIWMGEKIVKTQEVARTF